MQLSIAHMGFPGGSEGSLPAKWEAWVRSQGQKIPWRRKWQSTPVFLPGESHERRSLVGYSPRGRKESDTTEWLYHHWKHYGVTLKYLKIVTICCRIPPLIFAQRKYNLKRCMYPNVHNSISTIYNSRHVINLVVYQVVYQQINE